MHTSFLVALKSYVKQDTSYAVLGLIESFNCFVGEVELILLNVCHSESGRHSKLQL